MGGTTIRLAKDVVRASPLLRWMALSLLLVSIVAAYLVFSRDTGWRRRNRESRLLGGIAEHNGHWESARDAYRAALANNPYDWTTHLFLANLYNHRLHELDPALRHYLYVLAYAPEPAVVRRAEAEIAILRRMRSGELENPIDAVEEMFLAVESGAEIIFQRRLSPSFGQERAAQWAGWTRRGRGRVINSTISSSHDGFYNAQLELEFADETAMSIHMLCSQGDIWRLELGFP